MDIAKIRIMIYYDIWVVILEGLNPRQYAPIHKGLRVTAQNRPLILMNCSKLKGGTVRLLNTILLLAMVLGTVNACPASVIIATGDESIVVDWPYEEKIFAIEGHDQSQIDVINMTRVTVIRLEEQSVLNFCGFTFQTLIVTNRSQAFIRSGTNYRTIVGDAKVVITDGTLQQLWTRGSGVTVIYGSDFSVINEKDTDGLTLEEYQFEGMNGWRVTGQYGTLNRTTPSGMDSSILIDHQGELIFLVPEPLSLIAMTIGGLIMMGRKRQI